MKFYYYTESSVPLPYLEYLQKDLRLELMRIEEIPAVLGMHEMLIAQFDELQWQHVKLFREQTYQYLAVVKNTNSGCLPYLMRAGAEMILSFTLERATFKNIFCAVIEKMKLKDIAHTLAVKELSLLRRIYGLSNADKKLLSEQLFGVTSDSTFDVSLARLRKKLADPDCGDDFFRIITKKGRLYLVNALNDYHIPDFLTEEEV